jgi:hypothetical protein
MSTQTDRGHKAGAPPDLRGQYRAIGIEAVVAALRYGCAPKNEAYAPSKPSTTREQFDDLEA